MVSRYFFVVCWILVCTIACGNVESQRVERKESVVIPEMQIPSNPTQAADSTYLLSEIASKVDFVQLEITDASLLRNIMSVKVSDSHILVEDMGGIFLYTREGKFLAEIGRKGQGPSEYTSASFAVLDEEHQEVLIMSGQGGLKIYGYDGVYKRTISDTEPKGQFLMTSESRILLWKNKIFLTNRFPLMVPSTDLWSWALVDSSFKIDKKFYSPIILANRERFSSQIGISLYKPSLSEMAASTDFYNDSFRMCYGGGDTIYKYDITNQLFVPDYILSYEKKPSIEMAYSWGKQDRHFFEYLWMYDFLVSKDYIYLFLGKEGKSYIARYSLKLRRMDYIQFENEVWERRPESQVCYRILKKRNLFFKNDLSGGSLFCVDYKSENGKYLVDLMNSYDIETNIDIDALKGEKVQDPAGKQKLLDMLTKLTEDEQIVVIATLKE